ANPEPSHESQLADRVQARAPEFLLPRGRIASVVFRDTTRCPRCEPRSIRWILSILPASVARKDRRPPSMSYYGSLTHRAALKNSCEVFSVGLIDRLGGGASALPQGLRQK